MEVIEGDILDITLGVIVHQVNCRNKIGAGLSGQIIRKYTQVAMEYHRIFEQYEKNAYSKANYEHLLRTTLKGTFQGVQVADELIVVNLFSQFYYGNSSKTGVVYTDVDDLVNGLERIKEMFADMPVYIPWGIGCGLAGADWNEVSCRIGYLDIIAVKKA